VTSPLPFRGEAWVTRQCYAVAGIGWHRHLCREAEAYIIMESKEEVLFRTRKRICAAKSRKGMSWQDIFSKCDKDGSGYLELSELHMAIRESLNVPENAICTYELNTLFKEMDADRSGGVNIEELLNYLTQGHRTQEEVEARAQVRIMRVRKNLKMAFQSLGKNEMSIRKLFNKLDMDSDRTLSLYEFRTFVRMELKLSFWDVCNTDLDDFFKFIDKDGRGITAEELWGFVKSSHQDKPGNFSVYQPADKSENSEARRRIKNKTHKQKLLEDSFRSTSLPNLSRMPFSPSVVSLGRSRGPTSRNSLDLSSMRFFQPEKLGMSGKEYQAFLLARRAAKV